MRRRSLTTRVLLATIGVGCTIVLAGHGVWLLVPLFFAGATCAPVVAVANANVGATVRFSDTAEAFGWLATAIMFGYSLASGVAGVAIDHFGAMGGMYVAEVLVVTALVVSICTMRWHPDLRQEHLAAHPATGTVPTVTQ